MDHIENRLAALEAKVTAMEERRARLIPPELDNDKNIQQLQQEAIKSAVEGWRFSLRQNGVGLEAARFNEAKRKALKEMEEATKAANRKCSAEIAAAVEHYERTGQSPEGYNIIDDSPPRFPRAKALR